MEEGGVASASLRGMTDVSLVALPSSPSSVGGAGISWQPVTHSVGERKNKRESKRSSRIVCPNENDGSFGGNRGWEEDEILASPLIYCPDTFTFF